MSNMLGNTHRPHCDCNIEQHVSGKGEKCNYRYGVKRARCREKANFRQDLDTGNI